MKRPSSFPFSDQVEPEALDAAWRGIGARRARVRRVRRGLIATPIVAALALVLFVALRHAPRTSSIVSTPHVIALAGGGSLPPVWSSPSASVVSFDDGSRLDLAPSARLRPVGEPDPTRVELALDHGEVTFDIVPGGPRAWTIDAGRARVRVLGTRFTVRRDGDVVSVSVSRGKVRVESVDLTEGARDLVAGDEVAVRARDGGALRMAETSTPEQDASVEESAATGSARSHPAPGAMTPGATTAETTATTSATTATAARAGTTAAPTGTATPASARTQTSATAAPVDRMAEADAARTAGRPREAIAILAGVVDRGEPDASLAAFTIGKLSSEGLGDFMQGATWFERAIALGLPAALDEDAHARVVECYGRGGRAEVAARAAAVYETKFPAGRHLARVKRWKPE